MKIVETKQDLISTMLTLGAEIYRFIIIQLTWKTRWQLLALDHFFFIFILLLQKQSQFRLLFFLFLLLFLFTPLLSLLLTYLPTRMGSHACVSRTPFPPLLLLLPAKSRKVKINFEPLNISSPVRGKTLVARLLLTDPTEWGALRRDKRGHRSTFPVFQLEISFGWSWWEF